MSECPNNRRYLDIGNGRDLPLPFVWSELEFKLPGNFYESPDGLLIALYDESTRTGAIFVTRPHQYWKITQPCLRKDFFERIVPYAETAAIIDEWAL